MLLPEYIRDVRERAGYIRLLGLVHFAPWTKYRIFNSHFGRRCRLGGNCLIRTSSFGDFSYAEAGVRITHTSIGKYCSIGPGVMIGLAAHPVDRYASTHPVFYLNRPHLGYDFVTEDLRSDYTGTNIGNDVWIGANALVMDGVSIADGAIIGAGSVVTKDVEPYTIVGGVPAKPIRKRFDDRTIDALLEIKWWDKGETWIRDNAEKLTDTHRLVEVHDKLATRTLMPSEHTSRGECNGVS